MNDAFRVRGVEGVGKLDGPRQNYLGLQWSPANPVLQRQPVQKLHGDLGLVATLADVVNRADVGMIESGGGTSFTSETFQCLRVSGNVIRQELERNETTELGVLGFVNDAHTADAELFDYAVARDSLADHQREAYVHETDQVNESRGDGGSLSGLLA